MLSPWLNKENPLFKSVKSIVDKYDMMTLLVFGAPEDEYKPEILDILNKCIHIDDVASMILELKAIFYYWFDVEFSNENLFSMAEELVDIFILHEEKNNHGKVGEALYLKFTVQEFDSHFKVLQDIKDGDIYTVDELDKIFGVSSSVPVHIDNSTKGNYECVCEYGTEIH